MIIGRVLIVLVCSALASSMFPWSVLAEQVLRQGSFSGKSGHQTSGSVSIVKTDKGVEVRLGSSFNLDGAPGPYLGFGNSGRYDKASEFSRLKSNSGAQVYKLPGKIDTNKYNEIYVWCRPFKVPLGVAKLN